MKNRYLNLVFSTFLFMIFAAPSLHFEIMVPALLKIPHHIQKIVIIDRTEREKGLINIIEGGITGESIGQDDVASKQCIEGLYRQLSESDKFEVLRSNIIMKGGDRELDFAYPLDWKSVENICQDYKADALISLEFFDTDIMDNRMVAKAGFRIYDLHSGNIMDQFSFHHEVYMDDRNPDFIRLLTDFMDQDAIKNLSYEAGIIYGQRLTPYWVGVSRKYFNKPKKSADFSYGLRMMEVGNWEEAISGFTRALEDKKDKVKSRAAHNLAVVYEVSGEYEKALKWAQDAWALYGNTDSREYSYLLQQRIRDIEKLDQDISSSMPEK